jgi:CBS domain-containing protein
VAKLISWWISLGSQTSGGTLAPMFLVGATMGAALGHGVAAAFPGLHVSPAAFALVAMAATFGAATKALLASVVFAAEVTGEYHMVIPMLIGVAFAELVAEVFLTDRLMTEKLSHRGFRVDFRTETGALRMRLAHHVMRPAVCVPADADLREVGRVMREEGVGAVAVLDAAGRYTGLITASALTNARERARGATAGALAKDSVRPIHHDDYLASALAHLTAHELDGLPVVEHGRVVGQLDRADIAAERHRHHTALETRQPGWVTALQHRPRSRRPLLLVRHPRSWRDGEARAAATGYRAEEPHQTIRRLQAAIEDERAAALDRAVPQPGRPGPERSAPDHQPGALHGPSDGDPAH